MGASSITGFNWFLIILLVVVALMMIVVAVYTLLHYQHPEDRNQVHISEPHTPP